MDSAVLSPKQAISRGSIYLAASLFAALSPVTGAIAQNTSTSIPLDIIQEPGSYQDDAGNTIPYSYTRLGINVGVNGAAPKEYLFDTGSDTFNIFVGEQKNGSGPAWFPNVPTGDLSFYLYGDGTYGNAQINTTLSSLQFFNSATGEQVTGYSTPGGMPASAVIYWIETAARFAVDGDTPGAAIARGPLGTYYQDLTWQQNLDNGIPPQEGIFYGIFGAGDFGDSVTGNLTNSGYIVEANGRADSPGTCGQACLILGLTPALRAQFVSSSPWLDGGDGTFKLTGANAAEQFDAVFNFSLDGGKNTAALATLFDSGTTTIFLNDAGLLTAAVNAGQIDTDNCDGTDYNYCDALPGSTLSTTGTNAGSQSTSITTGDDTRGDQSNVVTVGPNPYTYDGQALYGVSFFLNNSVMYDLENKLTAFSPFYVTDTPITTNFKVTADMGPLGLAGTISGTGPLEIASGGIAQLSGTNTYTGATLIDTGAWLGLAGPGSIGASSNVDAEGTFDLSRIDGATAIQSLSGSGRVALGAKMLVLENADGVFSGQITDGGFGGGTGGRLLINQGSETLTGNNTYTGETTIAPAAALRLDGSLAGNVLDAGLLSGTGSTGGLIVTGVVAPGQIGTVGTLTVNGNLGLSAGSVYLVDMAGVNNADTLAVVANAGTGTKGAAFIGGNVLVTPVDGYKPRYGDHATILTAQGGINGTFSGTNALSAILYSKLSYSTNAVDVSIAARPYRDVIDTTSPVQSAYASLLDRSRGNPGSLLLQFYGQSDLMSQAQIQSTLESAAPFAQQTEVGLVRMQDEALAKFYRDRLSLLRHGGGGETLAVLGNPLGVVRTGYQTARDVASGLLQAPTNPRQTAVKLPEGVSAYVAGGYLDGSSRPLPNLISGKKDDLSGWYIAGGLEKQINDQTIAGFSASYSHGKGDTVLSERARSNLFQVAAYSTYSFSGGAFVNATVSGGLINIKTRRQFSLGDLTAKLHNEENAPIASGEIAFGYDLKTTNFTISPMASIRGSHLEFEGGQESGGVGSLTYDHRNFNSLQARIGGQLSIDMGGVHPHIDGAFVHDFLKNGENILAHFTEATGTGLPDANFGSFGRDRNWGEVGGGLSIVSGTTDIGVSADTVFGRKDLNYQIYRGSITFHF